MNALYIGIIAVIALVVVGVLATNFTRRRNRQQATTNAATASNTRNTGRRWFWQRNRRGDVLRSWLNDNLESDDVKAWLRALPEDDIKQLMTEIRDLSNQAQLDLQWLTSGALQQDETLYNSVKQVISLHVQSRYEVAQVADDVQVFAIYQRLSTNPTNKDGDLIKDLYGKLVENGAAPATPPEMSMASSKEGRTYAINQIKTAAANDWATFSATLKDVMAGGSAASGETATEAPTAPKEETATSDEKKTNTRRRGRKVAESDVAATTDTTGTTDADSSEEAPSPSA